MGYTASEILLPYRDRKGLESGPFPRSLSAHEIPRSSVISALPVEMAFTTDCAAFFPCSPEALICVQQPCLIALSQPLAVSPPPASALVCSRVQIGRFCSTTAVCHNGDHLLCDTRNSPPRCLHANPWPFHCCGCSSCGRWHAGGVHEKGGGESAISRPDLSASTSLFSFFLGKDLKLFHLFVYFFLRFYLDVTCWILFLGSFLPFFFLLKALVLLLAAKKVSWEEYLGQVQNRRETYLPSHLLPINSGIN